jgi:DNA-directed RNA polymerase specialized sigma24 family protein
MSKTKRLTLEQFHDLRDALLPEARDLAASLLGDPFEADDVVASLFYLLRNADPEKVGSPASTAEAARWVNKRVVRLCRARFAAMARTPGARPRFRSCRKAA